MSIIAVRSIGLGQETREAWRDAGVSYARRGRSVEEVLQMPYDMVLNLGKTSFITDDPRVWNKGQHIKDLVWPGTARDILGEMMPPRATNFPNDVWIKTPGFGGRGKFRKIVDQSLILPKEWDWQIHIEGQEYRLITVGHRLVQDLQRYGDNGERTYQWIRMREVPAYMKDMAREAARLFDGNNVIAWDMIDTGERGYILEGNTCPGVSLPTAERIVTEMKEQHNA